MPFDRMERRLSGDLAELGREGRLKGAESVVCQMVPADGERGPRVRLAGEGESLFLRMNSNGYLGMALRPEVIAAEEAATRVFGTGPQAVRFIGGTLLPHLKLEERLAAFHGREAAMIFSSAYAAVMGILPPLVTPETAVISDELNHNCIINAIRLSRPAQRHVYAHLDLGELESALEKASADCRRCIVVTDGVFSMRGDCAPLDRIAELVGVWDEHFAENAVLVVDDSHGVGALGRRGRGTEELAGAGADVLVATLGKALGVNGGYAVGSRTLVDYLREVAPFYVYSNPITAGEAAAAGAALDLLDGAVGEALLAHLRAMTARFEQGLVRLGYETLPGPHPVVPLLVRDTARAAALVAHLRAHGILATGLGYPVVPKGDEEIRFQISAEHTEADIDEVLRVLEHFSGRS
ncbi:MAG: pyridoxal phosphate-dependent aminotransferase family protein [Deltaproteobacteria bacterium]|nr:pyridoxal phosphate-dependent aminotransferase family protein [Deltaproteobacteria bacterium]